MDPPIEGEDNSKPRAKYQKISKCRGLNSQQLFTELRNTEIKASLMDNPDISREVKHRIQVALQPGSGTASLVVPTEECLDIDDNAAIQATCCRLGLTIPGLHMRTRCLPNCTQMGPHAEPAHRSHSEREHHDRHSLSRLQVLWHLRQAQPSSASGPRLLQVRAE